MAGDVYARAPYAGRGGWSWYTGSAGWMYRVGLESLLGFKKHGQTLQMDPCIPASWEDYDISWEHGRTRFEIHVSNPDRHMRGVSSATLDGRPVDPNAIPLPDDGSVHEIQIVVGPAAPLVTTPPENRQDREESSLAATRGGPRSAARG